MGRDLGLKIFNFESDTDALKAQTVHISEQRMPTLSNIFC